MDMPIFANHNPQKVPVGPSAASTMALIRNQVKFKRNQTHGAQKIPASASESPAKVMKVNPPPAHSSVPHKRRIRDCRPQLTHTDMKLLLLSLPHSNVVPRSLPPAQPTSLPMDYSQSDQEKIVAEAVKKLQLLRIPRPRRVYWIKLHRTWPKLTLSRHKLKLSPPPPWFRRTLRPLPTQLTAARKCKTVVFQRTVTPHPTRLIVARKCPPPPRPKALQYRRLSILRRRSQRLRWPLNRRPRMWTFRQLLWLWNAANCSYQNWQPCAHPGTKYFWRALHLSHCRPEAKWHPMHHRCCSSDFRCLRWWKCLHAKEVCRLPSLRYRHVWSGKPKLHSKVQSGSVYTAAAVSVLVFIIYDRGVASLAWVFLRLNLSWPFNYPI